MLVHGVADAVIPIRYARQALETLRKLPLKLFYREYGMAHQISEESLTDMLGWLEDKI
jgi:predicted esterase